MLLLLRRWFVYACAFVGAGWFGWYLYELRSFHTHIPGAMWGIIGAAVGVAFVLTFLPAFATNGGGQPVSQNPPASDNQPESNEPSESDL